MRIKRILRRLIPDRIMARYRLSQHSRQVRTNIDIFVSDPQLGRKWVAVTPDTVRVVAPPSSKDSEGSEPSTAYSVGETEHHLADYLQGDVEVVVAGVVGRPRLVGGRRSLPRVRPLQIVASPEVFQEVGGRPAGDENLAGLYRRVLDAGRLVGLVGVPGEFAQTRRIDPIREPAVVVVSAVPLHDVGGGSRGAQLALELVRQGFHVTLVSVFGVAESVDLGLRFIHPRLEQVRLGEFEVADYLARVERPTFCLLELPIAAATTVGRQLRRGGFPVVYDLIDDWTDPALGGEWFDPSVERSLVNEADLLCGSAPDLADRLKGLGGKGVLLVPNGVNAPIFGRAIGPVPDDFPAMDRPILGYHGSLYGDWFDWSALERVALTNPESHVVVIGDLPTSSPKMPHNVHFLGLKRQIELPEYVGRFDVGLIPFVVNDTTHAVSPLKAFEYLAMGVPVAAPPLRSLEGMEGLYTDVDLAEAAGVAHMAARPDRERSLLAHSWSTRVATMLRALGIQAPGEADPVRIVTRPVRHYSSADRDLTASASGQQSNPIR